METSPALLDGMKIRRTPHNSEWWFAVEDVVGALTDSVDPTEYIRNMRGRDRGLARGWRQFVAPLWLETPGGRELVDCANAEGIFRIIQSIPSPKAEPFKRWLAREACERMREMADPELVLDRTRELYRSKGYSEAWIGKRMRGIAIRAELTDEWQKRGVGVEPEQALLTEEISRAAFGLTPSEHKNLKGLARENLRDYMTGLEMIFSMLGEAATAEIARKRDARGFAENKVAARKGGGIAGEAREKLEQETGEGVVTAGNYLAGPEGRKRVVE